MLVYVPIAVGEDCHWKLIPLAAVKPVRDKVKFTPGHIAVVVLLLAVPAVGAPVQAVPAVMFTV